MASKICLIDVTEDGCADDFNAIGSPRWSSFDISVVVSTLDTDFGRLRNRRMHHGALFGVACVIVVSLLGVLVANFSHMTVADTYPVGLRSLMTHDVKVIGGMTFTWLIAAAALTIALMVYFGHEAENVADYDKTQTQKTKLPDCHQSHEKCKNTSNKIAEGNARVQKNLQDLRQQFLAGAQFESKLEDALDKIARGEEEGRTMLETLHETQFEFFRLADSGEFDTGVWNDSKKLLTNQPFDLDSSLDQVKVDVNELRKTGDYHGTSTTVSIEVVAAIGLESLYKRISGFDKYHELKVKVFAPGIKKYHETEEVGKLGLYLKEDAGRVVWDQAYAENSVKTRMYADDLVVFQLWDDTRREEFVAAACLEVDRNQLPLDCHLKLTGYGEAGLESRGSAFLRVKIREI